MGGAHRASGVMIDSQAAIPASANRGAIRGRAYRNYLAGLGAGDLSSLGGNIDNQSNIENTREASVGKDCRSCHIHEIYAM